MNRIITQTAMAAVASLALFSGTASSAEFLDFQVDEGSVPGAVANVLTADKLNGAYNERLTVDAVTGAFDTHAFASFTAFFADDGATAVVSQLNSFDGYNMYALFDSSGVYSGGTFTGVSGSFSLFLDPNQDTTYAFGATGADPITLASNADDYQIAGASNPTRMVGIPGTPGAFDFIWDDFTLTTAGEDYFIDPDPFYLVVRVNGDFDEFAIGGTVDLTGDVSAVFAVPEPASVALLGIGLLGLGFGARRRKV